ncbi:S1 family peptidase [Chenggangzhangella methanolivorans]|uniref:S1 family peptidase n=1 Tax=Chenggangzhangella methanolivorans TaxID=1437009 RepID=A0A9E6RDJ5_9HYPH|nr:S1 family peptidase [Chenggangzhangella methanolivorans]QZO01359.1 S1 family peptidase [Chenggangzhangella methanolivorans]
MRDVLRPLAALALAVLISAPAAAQTEGSPVSSTVSVQAVEPTADGRARVAECSGAFIAPDLVLTSGHCLDGAAGPARVAVFAYRDGKPVPKPLLARAIARFPGHVPGWKDKDGDPETRQREIAADMALIRLAEPVAAVRPLVLGRSIGGAISGAGATAPGGRSGVMKSATLSSVRASTGSGAHVVFATASKTVCGGDSGGPAVAVAADGSPALWGVVSAVLKPKGGCGTRIAITPVDPDHEGFRAMRAAVGRP